MDSVARYAQIKFITIFKLGLNANAEIQEEVFKGT